MLVLGRFSSISATVFHLKLLSLFIPYLFNSYVFSLNIIAQCRYCYWLQRNDYNSGLQTENCKLSFFDDEGAFIVNKITDAILGHILERYKTSFFYLNSFKLTTFYLGIASLIKTFYLKYYFYRQLRYFYLRTVSKCFLNHWLL